ncbi:MAG: hypothetical protein LH603_17045 [Pseudonocardia sp.]|nr:hypothetical protein [Pseudonocardia sp.]
MRSSWDKMADHAATRRRRRSQASTTRNRVLQRHADQTLQVAAVEHRTDRTEQARALRSTQEADAAGFTAGTAAELARLTELLRTAAGESPRDLAWFRRNVPEDAPPTLDDLAAPPRPEWSQYAPPPPGLFGRRRYERSLLSARADLDDALARHDRTLEHGLAELMAQHHARAEHTRRVHETIGTTSRPR